MHAESFCSCELASKHWSCPGGLRGTLWVGRVWNIQIGSEIDRRFAGGEEWRRGCMLWCVAGKTWIRSTMARELRRPRCWMFHPITCSLSPHRAGKKDISSFISITAYRPHLPARSYAPEHPGNQIILAWALVIENHPLTLPCLVIITSLLRSAHYHRRFSR